VQEVSVTEHGSTELDPLDAARMRAMGFDKPRPEQVLTDDDRSLIQSVLDDRRGEYFYGGAHGYRLDTRELAGVVADIVFAALRRDREKRGA
jgi:hypothetical protein